MKTKKWYLSKTIWVNVIALLASILQSYDNNINISATDQIFLLTILNLILRSITHKQIEW
jgi:hypothetical protein